MAAEKLMLDPRRPADEVLEEIKKDAETGGDGQYRLIITRQEGALGVLNTMAVFEGVTLQHLFDHIIWLPELIGDGGGMFRLKVVRGDTMTAIGGGFLSYQGPNGAQPKPFDLSIIDRPDWRGPRRLAQKTRTPEPIPSSPVSAFPPIPGGNLVPPSQVLPGQPAGGGTTPGNSAMEAFLQQQLAETRQQAMMNQLRMETQAQLQAMKQQTEQSNQAVLRALETLRAAPHPVALPPEKSTWTPEAIAGTLTAVLGGRRQGRRGASPGARRIQQGVPRGDAQGDGVRPGEPGGRRRFQPDLRRHDQPDGSDHPLPDGGHQGDVRWARRGDRHDRLP